MSDAAATNGHSSAGIRTWRQGGAEMPPWVSGAMVGCPQPNGTFLVHTPLGQRRVHPGDTLVEQAGDVYAWPAEEAQERITELRDRVMMASRPLNLVGPGKSLTSAIPPRTRKKRKIERPRSYPPVRGTPPSIEWVTVAELLVDQDYQRSTDNEPSRRLIASIAAHWDWRLCTPLAVSRRSDGKYVIDGQHRLAAAKLRRDLLHLPCCIATYEGPADEAAMFVAANRSRRAINRLDDFHAALVAGDEDALEVAAVVQRSGLRISRKTGSQSWQAGEIAFTSSITTVMGRHGEALVLDALKMIEQSFRGQVLSQGSSIFLGLTRILVSPPQVDRPRLARTLATRTMPEWGKVVQGVKGGDLRAQVMRGAILNAYESVE
jgi:hypothetical protein